MGVVERDEDAFFSKDPCGWKKDGISCEIECLSNRCYRMEISLDLCFTNPLRNAFFCDHSDGEHANEERSKPDFEGELIITKEVNKEKNAP